MPKKQADYSVRRAMLEDAEAFPAIEQSSGEAFRGVPGLEWIADDEVISAENARVQIASGSVWVAESPACEVIGFVTAERFGDKLHIWQASVLHELQGRGIGRALFAHVIAEARTSGATALTLTTFRDLAWNAPFYATLGFAIAERAEAGERLCAILDAEAARGLPPERRCAMRMALG